MVSHAMIVMTWCKDKVFCANEIGLMFKTSEHLKKSMPQRLKIMC